MKSYTEMRDKIAKNKMLLEDKDISSLSAYGLAVEINVLEWVLENE